MNDFKDVKEIVREYPFLQLIRKCVPHRTRYALAYVPSNWENTLLKMCAELKPILVEEKLLRKYRILKIGEYHGRLIWHDNCRCEAVRQVIEKYTNLLEDVCPYCGRNYL